ncbi:MAG: hypothetical protein H6563_01765 [Lewinellaceae bacterium]|nr:hypothetical protein [Lewinellaceae bacterium]
MRIVSILVAAALAVLSIFACQSTPSGSSPESVVRQWQAHIDKNEFEQAKALSAPRTQDLISWMEALLSNMELDSVISETNFKELSCKENGDKAVCYYTLEEEGQLFYDSFLLVQLDGKWLVDLPEDALLDEEGEDLESLYDMINPDSISQ